MNRIRSLCPVKGSHVLPSPCWEKSMMNTWPCVVIWPSGESLLKLHRIKILHKLISICLQSSITKAKFCKFKNARSFKSYRIQLSLLFILPLHWHLWSRCLPPERLGKMQIHNVIWQDQALLEIYNLLLNASINPETQDIEIDHPALMSLMHNFLVLILVEEHILTKKVSGLLEHVMALLFITPEGKMISTSFLTSVDNWLQRALFSILIHCAFLQSFDMTYKPEQCPDNCEDILETVPEKMRSLPSPMSSSGFQVECQNSDGYPTTLSMLTKPLPQLPTINIDPSEAPCMSPNPPNPIHTKKMSTTASNCQRQPTAAR